MGVYLLVLACSCCCLRVWRSRPLRESPWIRRATLVPNAAELEDRRCSLRAPRYRGRDWPMASNALGCRLFPPGRCFATHPLRSLPTAFRVHGGTQAGAEQPNRDPPGYAGSVFWIARCQEVEGRAGSRLHRVPLSLPRRAPFAWLLEWCRERRGPPFHQGIEHGKQPYRAL